METIELIDLIIEHGDPISAAVATGRTQEMIYCYQNRIIEEANNQDDSFLNNSYLTANRAINMRNTIDQLRKLL